MLNSFDKEQVFQKVDEILRASGNNMDDALNRTVRFAAEEKIGQSRPVVGGTSGPSQSHDVEMAGAGAATGAAASFSATSIFQGGSSSSSSSRIHTAGKSVFPPPLHNPHARALAVHLKLGKAFLEHLHPEEFRNCFLTLEFVFGSHPERKRTVRKRITGVEVDWDEVLYWEIPSGAAGAAEDEDAMLTGGAGGGQGDYEDDYFPYWSLEQCREELKNFHVCCLREWVNERSAPSASSTSTAGATKGRRDLDQLPEKVLSSVPSNPRSVREQADPLLCVDRVDMISSQYLFLQEGRFVYELRGCDKHHRLAQGLVEIEVQWLGGEWPLKPKLKVGCACGVMRRMNHRSQLHLHEVQILVS